MGGFWGRVLEVDLGSGTIETATLDETLFSEFLGGHGLAARLIYERQPGGVDPFGAEAGLGFFPGLLSGTGAPFSGRFMVAGKSPLTGAWGDSNAGGYFGPELKRAGWDGILVRGVAERPVYLYIKDGWVGLQDATPLWGLDTAATEATIRQELGDSQVRVAAIGPAGERLSRIASIITDGGRAAGRCGLGAVMGAKRLKAVAVRGSASPLLAQPVAFDRLCHELSRPFQAGPSWMGRLAGRLAPLMPRLVSLVGVERLSGGRQSDLAISVFREYGTALGLSLSVETGDAPVRNWSGIGPKDFPLSQSSRISDRAINRYRIARYGCADCPLGCGAAVSIPSGPFAVASGHRPQYEGLAAFGPLILNADPEAAIWANELCNRQGLDVIEAGTAIAFAIEAFERGVISEAEAGLALRWGDGATLRHLLGAMAERRGLGELLADGVARAAQVLGRGSQAWAVHVHGQAPGMHDPKYAPSQAAAYATDAAPGRHTSGSAAFAEVMGMPFPLTDVALPRVKRYQYSGKGPLQAAWSQLRHVESCLGLCSFSSTFGDLPLAELIEAAGGWKLTSQDLLTIGERIQTMRHLFNLREGLRPGDFALHPRLLGQPPYPTGPTAGVTVDAAALIADYFQAMGWDQESGWPRAAKLEALGLSQLVPGHGGPG